jgi:hypothetical protein
MIRRANPWPWFAAAVLTLVAGADSALIFAARGARLAPVEERPWLASTRIDAAKAARAAFAASGMRLVADDRGDGRLGCAILPAGSAIGAATVALYRPDDPRLDRRLAWSDTATPLLVEGLRAGQWRARLEDAAGREIAELVTEVR